jgi:hypothetical protein
MIPRPTILREIFFSIFIIISICPIDAQDKIIKKDNLIVEGTILKVTDVNIEIDPTGNKPFLIIPRNEVKMIIYSDNTVVDFENQNNKDVTNTVVNVNKKETKKAILRAYATFDIIRDYRAFGHYEYFIDKSIPFIDTLNNQEFFINLIGGFSVTSGDHNGFIVRDLKLKIELGKDGTRYSENLLLKRSYTILRVISFKDYSGTYQEMDRIESINLNNNFVDLRIKCAYIPKNLFLETNDNREVGGDKLMGSLEFTIDWSNY